MVEKLPILDHHVALILQNDGFITENERRRKRMALSFVNYLAGDGGRGEYCLTGEKSKKQFANAFEEAALAILRKNFTKIPDKTGWGDRKRQNYDLICRSCPNYVAGEKYCPPVQKDLQRLKKREETIKKSLGIFKLLFWF